MLLTAYKMLLSRIQNVTYSHTKCYLLAYKMLLSHVITAFKQRVLETPKEYLKEYLKEYIKEYI